MDPLSIFLLATGFCAFAYAIHLTILNNKRLRGGTVAKSTSKQRARFLRIGPAICLILAVVATVLAPLHSKTSIETCPEDEKTINPDVGGIGVLLGLFLPCLVLLLVLLSGHFTSGTSGAKELCMAQCASRSNSLANRL